MSFSKIWNCLLAIVCPVVCAAPGFAQDKVGEEQAFFITFQVPGSTNTSPSAVNNAGSVAGSYANPSDPYQAFHGFLRDARGAITTFDIPGAIPRSLSASTGRGPSSVNTAKRTTGTTALFAPRGERSLPSMSRGAMFIAHSRRASTTREPSPERTHQSMGSSFTALCATHAERSLRSTSREACRRSHAPLMRRGSSWEITSMPTTWITVFYATRREPSLRLTLLGGAVPTHRRSTVREP